MLGIDSNASSRFGYRPRDRAPAPLARAVRENPVSRFVRSRLWSADH
jgi:hypothetical protein